MQIRPMTEKDATAVQELSRQLGYDLSPAETKEQIRLVTGHPDHEAFVAVREEGVVGWIHAFKAIRIESPPFIEIGGLVVDENFRGKGVGRELCQWVRRWAAQQGFSSLKVRSNRKRTAAHRFYENLGFRETKEQKVFEQRV